MQAHQFVTALSYGDAIGDYTLEIQRILRARGYESEIFSEIVHPRMARHVKPLSDYVLCENDENLLIVHFSIGSELGNFFPHFRGRKLMIYHNITPYRWFVDVNPLLAFQCLVGRKQLEVLKDYCPIALGDSEYNRQELETVGFRKTGVLPIRLDFSRFDGEPDRLIGSTYDDHRTNIIVVGRVIPNKKLEDCMKLFAAYQKLFNPMSRLIFAGLWNGFDPYYHALRRMAAELKAQDVVFTGHISFEELIGLFRIADALLIMSEHEGFCVPVLEAFYMKVPVLAWSDCAIPYTVGKGAVLLQETKDLVMAAGMLNEIAGDTEVRKKVVAAQTEQILLNNRFPFEKTLLDTLEDLKKTKSIVPTGKDKLTAEDARNAK